MGAMFKSLFSMFTFLFSAGGKVAESLDVMATSGLEMANQHLEAARHERQKEYLTLQRDIEAFKKQNPATIQQSAPQLIEQKAA